jgi:hypothetical protein
MFSEQKEIFGPQEGGFRGWVYWRLALFFLYPKTDPYYYQLVDIFNKKVPHPVAFFLKARINKYQKTKKMSPHVKSSERSEAIVEAENTEKKLVEILPSDGMIFIESNLAKIKENSTFDLYFTPRSKTPLTQPQKDELKKEIETIFRNTYGKNAGNVTLF